MREAVTAGFFGHAVVAGGGAEEAEAVLLGGGVEHGELAHGVGGFGADTDVIDVGRAIGGSEHIVYGVEFVGC